MPSLYSRFTHNPLQRMLLVQAGGVFLLSTLALFGSSDTSRSGAASPIGDASAYTLLIGAILAACSAAPNTYTVHSGAYPSRDWRDFDEHFEALFRFDKADISHLVHALQLPSKVVTRDRKTFTRDQAITVLLLRFNNYTLHKIHRETGIRPSNASTLLSWLYDFMWDKWYVRLLASDLKRWTPEFQEYKMYVTAVLLSNAFCCINGSQTCEYFGIYPPSLEDYFGQAPPQPAGRAQAWDDNVSS